MERRAKVVQHFLRVCQQFVYCRFPCHHAKRFVSLDPQLLYEKAGAVITGYGEVVVSAGETLDLPSWCGDFVRQQLPPA